MDVEIDEDLINWVRKNRNIVYYETTMDEQPIINVGVLAHENLAWQDIIYSSGVDQIIWTYYHQHTNGMLTDGEWQSMRANCRHASRNIETALRPFSFKILGAYHYRPDLYYKFKSITSGNRCKINAKTVNKVADLIPYFTRYAEGFKYGFDSFEEEQIKPLLTIIANPQEYASRVVKYLFDETPSMGIYRGFETDLKHEITDGYEEGLKYGLYYRAWSIVFSNNELFAPLFRAAPQTPPPVVEGRNKVEKNTKGHKTKQLTYDCKKRIILKELHKSMKGKFVDNNTTLKNFCRIFEAVETDERHAVVWLKSVPVLLYFLHEMMNAGIIDNEITRMNYGRLKKCFVKADGSVINENLKELFQQVKDSRAGHNKEISAIVKRLK